MIRGYIKSVQWIYRKYIALNTGFVDVFRLSLHFIATHFTLKSAEFMVQIVISVNFKARCYTQATSKGSIQLGLETPLGEALVEDNSYPIVKINNDG